MAKKKKLQLNLFGINTITEFPQKKNDDDSSRPTIDELMLLNVAPEKPIEAKRNNGRLTQDELDKINSSSFYDYIDKLLKKH
ncbi:MAG: hypothetical protein IPI98_02565 [Chitinophagaceae bacterium]|nr:hypothetical protein [Chitinophagaceae bacterium]